MRDKQKYPTFATLFLLFSFVYLLFVLFNYIVSVWVEFMIKKRYSNSMERREVQAKDLEERVILSFSQSILFGRVCQREEIGEVRSG